MIRVTIKNLEEATHKKTIASLTRHLGNIGKQFGQLTVKRVYRGGGDYHYRCKCTCGNTAIMTTSNLLLGKIQSCGCVFQSEELRKHQSKIRIKHGYDSKYTDEDTKGMFSRWKAMIARCYNKKVEAYKNYGGRGIKVCKRWRNKNNGFENYLKDMGYPPTPDMSIDRKNNDKGYYPSNCKWSTASEQVNNRRKLSNTRVNLEGKKFGLLKVVKDDLKVKIECKCKCGNYKTVSRYNLETGNVKSCGCLYKKEIREAYYVESKDTPARDRWAVKREAKKCLPLVKKSEKRTRGNTK